MEKFKIYCVTNKELDFLNNSNYKIGWVSKEDPLPNYIVCDKGDNIFYKEKYYSELTFHYWYWKNLLDKEKDGQWIGFCQKRRYWVKEKNRDYISKSNLNKNLLFELEDDSRKLDSIICDPIEISGAKKIKMIKRGWKNLIKNPNIFFNKKKQNIEFHFDMHHGIGNLSKAINLLDVQDKSDFSSYVKNNTKYNPHIMFIAKKEIVKKWFNTLFPWLERCESVFGFDDLKGYDTTRLYAYLAERYLSFWFKKYTVFKEQPWVFIDK